MQMAEIRTAQVIASGKTKEIREASEHQVYVCSLDNITAGDGARKDTIFGKAESANRTTCNVFDLLKRAGFKTSYLGLVNGTSFLARKLNMIPLECVVRRIATGSYLKRNPQIAEGKIFETPIFEVFEKDDAHHDPMLSFNFEDGLLRRYDPKLPKIDALFRMEPISDSRFNYITADTLEFLEAQSIAIFETLEERWKCLGGTLFDFKIEFGFDTETNEILLGDVIDSDSWRLRFDGEAKDKQAYRDGTKPLADIAKDYAEVAKLTDKFDSF